MTKKAEASLRYTLATHAAEHMSPSAEALSLCERIADNSISSDHAVALIKQMYGVEGRQSHA